MNKSDKKFLMIVSLVAIVLFSGALLFKSPGSVASVYYDGEKILDIDLNIDDNYQVNGYNGIVEIEVKNSKIRVINENSPLNLCQKQGSINNTNQTIICLPNKIVIKIGNDEKYDAIVK